MRAARFAFSCVAACLAAAPLPAQYDCSGVPETSNTELFKYQVVSGLTQSLFLGVPPGDRQRLFIVERGGRIKIHRHGTARTAVSTFLDITAKVESSGQEMGLLGLAFDPDYQATGRFWVNYTEVAGGQIFTVIARYTAEPATSDTANPASEVRVLRFNQPEINHNGGMLAFGPDGYLYVFTGDGGGSGDDHGVCGNGQDRTVLLGKILRLDVRGVDPGSTSPDCGLAGASYGIPATNPLRDGPGIGHCDEIWAYGLRNPWRASFDAATADLYVADVGENCWEEVNWTAATSTGGENYGWRQMEGLACYDGSGCDPEGAICGGSPPCNDPGFTLPVLVYSHSNPDPGCAITGGYVYRGCRMPNFRGTYVYGDACVAGIRTLRMVGGVATDPQTLGTFPGPLTAVSFGVDAQGELYVVQLGSVWKLLPPFSELEVSGPGVADTFRLAKAGDWIWEDLLLTHDITPRLYRVYRGTPGGAYSCVFRTTAPAWPAGGDPMTPLSGELFTYVVTALHELFSFETTTGATGTFDASTCP